MLSIPHMIVVFLVVLVVFGPQKLPELARSFGKLMAEFRKASSDFKNAFEEEMRDLERQARIAELKKQVAEANAAADAATRTIGTPGPMPVSSAATTPLAEAAAQSRSDDLPVVNPVPEAVRRLDGANGEMRAPENPGSGEPTDTTSPGESATTAKAEPEPESEKEPALEKPPSHDQQQPA
jgi:TatA/E family protein of Tat protein translocase